MSAESDYISSESANIHRTAGGSLAASESLFNSDIHLNHAGWALHTETT